MSDPAFLRRLAHRLQSVQENSTENVTDSTTGDGEKSLERKRSRVIDMFMEGDISKEDRAERLSKISEQLGTVTEDLTRLPSVSTSGG